ncbi:MAG: acetyltransferase [Candidatus Cloacimonetes bacterium]|jgi:sugar O-acyltransferase (sialic acid O-acetyltransferase NeuD family)|nr:acetyltransferase [Candidatus Cloacimonadota bacterium]MBT5990192.1 acetyltransferase [Bacteroidota bacterium]MBT7995262.1 acetyltransferase [Bacteroidota bacterium]
MKEIIIIGTGGNCVDILDTIIEINKHQNKNIYRCLGFVDDNSNLWNKSINGVKVLGGLSEVKKYPNSLFVFGIGSSNNYIYRNELRKKIDVSDERFETIIHPTAFVSSLSLIGKGSIILQNVTIASNVQLNNFVVVLPNSIVSHDCNIGEFTLITGGVCISGSVTIGRNCYLGTNSTIKEGLNIGEKSLVGMGSVVIRDIEKNNKVVGNPARVYDK